MRRWLDVALPTLQLVSERPALWVVGGLAWAATAGPIALFAAVVPLPTVSDLTYLAARTFVAGAWPWNAITLGVAAMVLVLLALLLVTISDAALVLGHGPPPGATARAYGVAILGAAPVGLPLVALTAAVAATAPAEFLAPDADGAEPLLRTAGAVAPLLAAAAVAALVGAAWAAGARVRVVARGESVTRAAVTSIRSFTTGVSVTHAVVAAGAWLAYLGLAITLLGVLWSPIGERLGAGAGFGAAEAALLVGFVAIWLCLVLGGGALHAWGVVSWTRILTMRPAPLGRGRSHPQETPSTP